MKLWAVLTNFVMKILERKKKIDATFDSNNNNYKHLKTFLNSYSLSKHPVILWNIFQIEVVFFQLLCGENWGLVGSRTLQHSVIKATLTAGILTRQGIFSPDLNPNNRLHRNLCSRYAYCMRGKVDRF